MKDFFTIYDFNKDGGQYIQFCEWARDIANAKLNAEIEKWPVVRGSRTPMGWNLGTLAHESDTNKGRFAFIEEIRVVECDHEPKENQSWQGQVVSFYPKCKKCHKKLKANWSVDE